MKRLLVVGLVLTVALLSRVQPAAAHCQVPCGIFEDEHRFEAMLEDQTTIAKAMTNIREMAGKTEPLSLNQLARWVATKETHADHVQEVIAQYFMAQRIKPGTDDASNQAYVKKLVAAHAVMTAAMKCKQNVDAAVAETLQKAILDFYRAYEGKEPAFAQPKK